LGQVFFLIFSFQKPLICGVIVCFSVHVSHPQYSIHWSSIKHLSEGTRNAP
jgi:hypothetical protein